MAKIKKTDSPCVGKDAKKKKTHNRKLTQCWRECKTVQAGIVGKQFVKKCSIHLIYDPAGASPARPSGEVTAYI